MRKPELAFVYGLVTARLPPQQIPSFKFFGMDLNLCLLNKQNSEKATI